MVAPFGNFYEFFAGAGMARAGIGPEWNCLFSNDFDQKKAATYRKNWGDREFFCGDVRDITTKQLPENADLVWASFPCQDLSLAGGGAGLKGERSGTFWPFWNIMTSLADEGRAPSVLVLENVCGTLSSHNGKDFAAICNALLDGGYQYGALVVDAALFVPQSRPRLFVVAVREGVDIPETLVATDPEGMFHNRTLIMAYKKLPEAVQQNWIWWKLQEPPRRTSVLADLIEDDPGSVKWHSAAETQKLLSMMSNVNLEKVNSAKREGKRVVGCIYKRTRRDENGFKVQRAEVRFDNVAGCLRTPAGGSSRQLIIVVEGQKVRSRLISTRETARLMGLPDEYELPEKYNEAYHLTGDGVVVPVVRFLTDQIFEPIIAQTTRTRAAA